MKERPEHSCISSLLVAMEARESFCLGFGFLAIASPESKARREGVGR